ncbi:hypothetical protein BH09VER1_BH09VER1_23810 [soil metagenome]
MPTLPIANTLLYSMPGGRNAVDLTNDPNGWFADQFPEVAALYGAAFLEGSYLDDHQFRHVVPSYLNVDFFAGMLGGCKRLGHQIVYHQQEDRFYFYDPLVQAFSPTSEEKLELLLSNYLIRCSQACGRLVDITPLATTFREHKSLKEVIQRAKALLQADSTFFTGKDGHRRWIDGKYVEPTDEPAYKRFLKQSVVPDSCASMTLPELFDRFLAYCTSNHLPTLQRAQFKAIAGKTIREEHHIGIRHDIDNGRGQITHGWKGLSLVDPMGVSGNN